MKDLESLAQCIPHDSELTNIINMELAFSERTVMETFLSITYA